MILVFICFFELSLFKRKKVFIRFVKGERKNLKYYLLYVIIFMLKLVRNFYLFELFVIGFEILVELESLVVFVIGILNVNLICKEK